MNKNQRNEVKNIWISKQLAKQEAIRVKKVMAMREKIRTAIAMGNSGELKKMFDEELKKEKEKQIA